MSSSMYFTDTAKVMAKGQITIPRDVRERLGVGTGDKVTFVVDGDRVVVANSAVFAMEQLSQAMVGQGVKAGFNSDDDVVEYIKKMRREDNV